jgi:diadenylate cyclase
MNRYLKKITRDARFMFFIDWPRAFYTIFTIVDILVVTFIFYKTIIYIFHTRTANILKGILGIAVVFFSAHLFKLKTLLWLFEKIIAILPLAVLIIFQQEIRRLLAHLGTPRIFLRWGARYEQEHYEALQKIFASMKLLSERSIGALILLEQEVELKSIKEKAIPLNADISEQLLVSIFIPTTPLHDGAVVIKGDKILVARAFFPITEERTAPYLGSRHRAAIGITEHTDSIVLIVSEETGYVSMAHKGKIFYNIGLEKLKEKVFQIFGYGT